MASFKVPVNCLRRYLSALGLLIRPGLVSVEHWMMKGNTTAVMPLVDIGQAAYLMSDRDVESIVH
jgi:hypothetical protein